MTDQQTINHLNDMLRDRGYSQGEIDAYVSHCELVQILVDVIAGVEQHLPACAAYPNGDPTNCTCHIVALTIAREAGFVPTGQEPPTPF